jgi:hypothetical protein
MDGAMLLAVARKGQMHCRRAKPSSDMASSLRFHAVGALGKDAAYRQFRGSRLELANSQTVIFRTSEVSSLVAALHLNVSDPKTL